MRKIAQEVISRCPKAACRNRNDTYIQDPQEQEGENMPRELAVGSTSLPQKEGEPVATCLTAR
jgi:hypothetical protein